MKGKNVEGLCTGVRGGVRKRMRGKEGAMQECAEPLSQYMMQIG